MHGVVHFERIEAVIASELQVMAELPAPKLFNFVQFLSEECRTLTGQKRYGYIERGRNNG
jgi:hypothetical protein